MDEINYIREENGLQIVVIDDKLQVAANERVNQQATQQYISHNMPERFSQVIERNGYHSDWYGEILAVGYSDTYTVTQAWMASLPHRRVIIYPNWVSVGIGTVNNYWVVLFGDR